MTGPSLTTDLRDVVRSPTRTVRPSRTLREVASELAEDSIGLLVVLGPTDAPIGVVSERDLVRAIADGEDLDTTRVLDVMTDEIVTIEPSATLREAAEAMHGADVRHLVVHDGTELVGVVSARDVTAAAGRRTS